MTPDSSLEKFLQLIDKNSSRHSIWVVLEIFDALKSSDEAFVYLFDNLATHMQEQLIHHQQFRDCFLQIMKRDEKKFQQYFFKGFEKFADESLLWDLINTFPKDQKLADFFSENAKPNTIDKAIEFLHQSWSANNGYYEKHLQQYRHYLLKLPTIAPGKSRAVNRFFNWGRQYIQKEGIEAFDQFCQTININIPQFCLKHKTSFDISNELPKLPLQDWKFIMQMSEKALSDFPNHLYPYKIVEKTLGFVRIISLLKQWMNPQSFEHFHFLWTNQQDYIGAILQSGLSEKANPLQLLETLQANKALVSSHKIYGDNFLYESDIDKFVQYAKKSQSLSFYNHLDHQMPSGSSVHKKLKI